MTRIPRQTTDARSGAGCFGIVPLGTPPKRILTPRVEKPGWRGEISGRDRRSLASGLRDKLSNRRSHLRPSRRDLMDDWDLMDDCRNTLQGSPAVVTP